jgi:hypothetical protein
MHRIIFLHHSTGHNIWLGGTNQYLYKLTGKGRVSRYFDDYNRKNGTDYEITDRIFPKSIPYGWKNYPFDYYNIWVRNEGPLPYMEEPTLEILTARFDVIIFKHCFPVGRIMADRGIPDINSEEKRLENYKLQYNALKYKMYSFPEKKFIVWTPPASIRGLITSDEAERTREFCSWMTEIWKEKGDNIYIWDFHKYETEGGLFLEEKNAYSPNDNHPGKEFSERMAPLFGNYIIDVINSESVN